MILGILGLINSGKGSIADTLVKEYDFNKDSFAASLKDVCVDMFDWPRDLIEGDTKESREWREQPDKWWSEKLGIPNFTPRLALQLVGTDALRNHFNNDIWFLTLANRIRKSPDKDIVIADVRFPNEINMVKESGGKLILVKRGPDPVWFSIAARANNGDEDAQREMQECFPEVHFSEWAWIGCGIDHIIINDGTIAELEENVKTIIEED